MTVAAGAAALLAAVAMAAPSFAQDTTGSKSGTPKPSSGAMKSDTMSSGKASSDTLKADSERAGSKSGRRKASSGAMKSGTANSGAMSSDTMKAGSKSGRDKQQ
jgi:hypothetical protein